MPSSLTPGMCGSTCPRSSNHNYAYPTGGSNDCPMPTEAEFVLDTGSTSSSALWNQNGGGSGGANNGLNLWPASNIQYSKMRPKSCGAGQTHLTSTKMLSWGANGMCYTQQASADGLSVTTNGASFHSNVRNLACTGNAPTLITRL